MRSLPDADQPLRQRSTSAACQTASAISPMRDDPQQRLPDRRLGEGGHRAGLVGGLPAAAEPGQLDRQPGHEQVDDAVGDQPDPGQVLEGVAVAGPPGGVLRGHERLLRRQDGQRLSVARGAAAAPAEPAGADEGECPRGERRNRHPDGAGDPETARRTWPQWLALGLGDDRRRRRRRPVGRRPARGCCSGRSGCSWSSAARCCCARPTAKPWRRTLAARARSLGTAALAAGAVALVVAVASAGLAAAACCWSPAAGRCCSAGAGALLARGGDRPPRRAGAAGRGRCWSPALLAVTGLRAGLGPGGRRRHRRHARWPSPCSACRCWSPPSTCGPSPHARSRPLPAGCAGCACGAGGCGS